MKKVLLILIIGFIFFLIKITSDSGAFKSIIELNVNSCHSVAQIIGTEDFAYSKKLNLMFVSSDDRSHIKDGRGDLWIFDPSQKTVAKPITQNLKFEFHPHGISLFESEEGTFLFAINHRKDRSTVELFQWNQNFLQHKKTIESELLITPNALVAVSEDRFYITLDHGSENEWEQKFENFSYMGKGSVLFFNHDHFVKVANGISFANGIAIDLKSQTIIVASMLGRKLLFYSIGSEPTELRLQKEISLSSAPDNIYLADDHRIYVGAHSQLLKLKAHSKKISEASPWEVIRVSDWLSSNPKTETLLSHNGKTFSAVSVAHPVNSKLYLGVIFQEGLFECEGFSP